jgi:tRNA (guanine37-N1)-methyltransferase
MKSAIFYSLQLNSYLQMSVLCVRVVPTAGESTRQWLAEADLLDREYQITDDGEYLYIPVTNPALVDDSYTLVEHAAPKRETPTRPKDVLSYEPTYERLGDIAILDTEDTSRAEEIADAIMTSDLQISTVINRASKIKGAQRVRDWDVIRGADTETTHSEYGYTYTLDIAKVYFSPRLATERHRVVTQIDEDENVIDMFAGVGPFAIPAADRGNSAVACDINPTAISYLDANAEENHVTNSISSLCDDVRKIQNAYAGWADRLIMNLPHTADEFLDAAVTMAAEECIIHYYDIQSDTDRYTPAIRAVRDAATPLYDVQIDTRRTVRSYAPHESNVVIDAHLK